MPKPSRESQGSRLRVSGASQHQSRCRCAQPSRVTAKVAGVATDAVTTLFTNLSGPSKTNAAGDCEGLVMPCRRGTITPRRGEASSKHLREGH